MSLHQATLLKADDPACKLAQHRFASGDYITIMEDERAHTDRVAAADPL